MSFATTSATSLDSMPLKVNASTGTPHSFHIVGTGFTASTTACFCDSGTYDGHHVLWQNPTYSNLSGDISLDVTMTATQVSATPGPCPEPQLRSGGEDEGSKVPRSPFIGLTISIYQGGSRSDQTVVASYSFVQLRKTDE